MNNRKNRVCPVEISDSLDSKLRRWIQNPRKILSPYIKKGMTVLDLGCGPGFFTIDIAKMVGKSGRVIASDLQEGMLQKLRDKIRGTELEEYIILHKSEEDKIAVLGNVDFILLFYMVHEVPSQEAFFNELITILKPNGQVFMIEPPFHVSKKDFENTIKIANTAGFKVTGKPKSLFDKSVIFEKDQNGGISD
ncbi:MAG: class I SAM-dependent methyltransferase [Candidatus Aminicenantes bacterium]|nr:class I SAM-dependent methyltransferase [Candidatus Aminicenantes bacterium]